MERLKAHLMRRKLSASWNGDVLDDGTLALVPKQMVAEKAESNSKRHSFTLAASDRDKIRIAHSNIQGSQPNHFDTLSLGELQRLLRSLNIPISGHENKEELLRHVQFAMECDDPGFDSAPLPDKLERWQLMQAYLLVVIYFYASSTRALEQLMMCRTLGGSGDSADPEALYQPKCSRSMLHLCVYLRPYMV
jgi:hypothetical protein